MDKTNNDEQDFLWADNLPAEVNNDQKNEIKHENLAGVNPQVIKDILQGSSRNDSTAKPSGLFNDETEDEIEEAVEEITEKKYRQSDAEPKKDKTSSDENVVTVARSKLALLNKLIRNIDDNTLRLKELLAGDLNKDETDKFRGGISDESEKKDNEDKIIEGVFNGTHMIGPDGKQYTIPANYASKSKLVEGDILKLTITPNGRFVYKQIGPIERIRLIGKLKLQSNSECYVITEDNRQWRILMASVTYFKGQNDDETIILVPKHGDSVWAAVENIVSRM
ncbi:MAG: hypothetical protein Q8Q23_00420 [bacterium]|nr:hypothetical protein [bacterium]